MDLPARFRAHLASLALPSGPALVAVSGGLDSVVLLDLLHRTEAPTRQLVVVAARDADRVPDAAGSAADTASLVEIARTGWFATTQALTWSSMSRSSSAETGWPWVKSKRSLSGPT